MKGLALVVAIIVLLAFGTAGVLLYMFASGRSILLKIVAMSYLFCWALLVVVVVVRILVR